MFLLILIGVTAKKIKLVTVDAAGQFSSIVSCFVVPMVMINALQIKRNPDSLKSFWLAVGLAVLFHIIAIVGATFLVNKRDPRYKFERMAMASSNAGFMALPLVEAVMGNEALLYATGFLTVFNLVVWSWSEITVGGRRFHIANLVQPATIGVVIGMALFLLDVALPQATLGKWVGFMASLNTPLAMIILGVFIADINIKNTLTNPRAYWVVLFKNFLFPLLIVGIAALLHIPSWFPEAKNVATTIAISASAPSAVSTVLVAAKYRGDSVYSAQLIALSTLVSIVSIPLLVLVANTILI